MDDQIKFEPVTSYEPKSNNRNQAKDENKAKITKSIIFFSFLLLVSLNSNIGFMNYTIVNNCIFDWGMNLMQPINKFLHSDLRDYLEILGSFLIDLIMITTAITWIFEAKTWGLIMSLFCFYFSRAIFQAIFIMPFPANFNFYWPGFPSMLVPYGRTSDFFWSGHIGLPIIAGLDMKKRNHFLFYYISIGVSVFEGLVMLAISGHYTVDLIFGVIIALYVCIMMDRLIDYSGDCFIMKDNQVDIKN